MSRVLICMTVLLVLPVLGILIFLRADGIWTEQRTLRPAFSDLVFYWDVKNTEAKRRKPPPLNRQNYLKARERFLASKGQIRAQAYSRMQSWSPEVIPWLMDDLQNPPSWEYINGLATVLAELEYAPAEPLLIQHLYDYHKQDAIHEGLFKAIGTLGLKNSRAKLIAWQLSRVDQQGHQPAVSPGFLIAVAKTGGKHYLLHKLKTAHSSNEIVSLIEPLAYTFDPEVVALLMTYAQDEREPVSKKATRALDDIVAPMAISALTDQFFYNDNPFFRRSIIENHFDDNDIFHDPRILPLLTDLLNDPLYKNNAAYALLNNETPQTIAALSPLLAWDNLDRLFIDLDFYHRKNQKIILLKLLDHPGPRIRIQALEQLWFNPDPDVTEKLLQVTDDAEPQVREKAIWAARAQAKVRLLYDLIAPIIDDPDSMKHLVDRKFFKLVIWPEQHIVPGLVLLILMLLPGVLLVFEISHIFDRYRANAFLHALLMTGLLGCFWIFSSYPEFFVYSIAVWLLLLLGYLNAQQNITAPDHTVTRSGLLNGLRLAIFTPGVLILLSPLLAEALQQVLIQPRWFEWCLLIWLLSLTFLGFECIFTAAPVALKRVLIFIMSSGLFIGLWGVLTFYVWINLDVLAERQSLQLWVVMPLILVLFVVWLIGLIDLFKKQALLNLGNPSEYFYLHPALDPLTIVERSSNLASFKNRMLQWLRLSSPVVAVTLVSLIFLCPALMMLQASGFNSDNLTVLILLNGSISFLVAWELIISQPLLFPFNIQLAQGYIRTGYVRFGFAFSGGYWGKRLRPDIRLTQDEKTWINNVLTDQLKVTEETAWQH